MPYTIDSLRQHTTCLILALALAIGGPASATKLTAAASKANAKSKKCQPRKAKWNQHKKAVAKSLKRWAGLRQRLRKLRKRRKKLKHKLKKLKAQAAAKRKRINVQRKVKRAMRAKKRSQQARKHQLKNKMRSQQNAKKKAAKTKRLPIHKWTHVAFTHRKRLARVNTKIKKLRAKKQAAEKTLLNRVKAFRKVSKWVCEDRCLDKEDNSLCGTTDHFRTGVSGLGTLQPKDKAKIRALIRD